MRYPRSLAVIAVSLLVGVGAFTPLSPFRAGAATTATTVHRHTAVVVTDAKGRTHTTDISTQDVTATITQVRSKVKYVFVLYQENRSFDSYFGTYPGANGIYSQSASQTPGYYQSITNTNGTTSMIQPIRIGPTQFSSSTDDVDHSHSLIDAKMDIVTSTTTMTGTPQMDRFAQVEEGKYLARVASGASNPVQAKQFGELAMTYEDCDTIPMLWNYAKNFTLFDNIYQLMTGPSTPGNLAIIAAQTGQTQLVQHPNQAITDNGNSSNGVPFLNDRCPQWGSSTDPYSQTTGAPFGPRDCPATTTFVERNLTFASLPLSFEGPNAMSTFSSTHDLSFTNDLGDVSNDLGSIANHNAQVVPWGWYEEGYNHEPTDPGPMTAGGTHASYVTHHNGPQYFGYVMNNDLERSHLHGLNDFFNDVISGTLPITGGVFYVKGGYQNILGQHATDPDPIVQKNFIGDDDHPAYSDAQISEYTVAKEVDAIARSPYWNQSAIIITYDDSEGDYDHSQPPIVNVGPGLSGVITDGPRVPFILISPYARQGYISHLPGDHGSVVKFVDELFSMTPLADLPAELNARNAAATTGITGTGSMTETNFGPDDDLTGGISDLVDAFDGNRLANNNPIPASSAEIPAGFNLYPTQEGQGCAAVGITPVKPLPGESAAIPTDFNPRPSTDPSTVVGSGVVSPTTGGTITGTVVPNRTTTFNSLVVPSLAVTEAVTISVNGVISGSAPADPTGSVALGDVLAFTGTGSDGAGIGQLTVPSTLILTFNPNSLPAGVTAQGLGIYAYIVNRASGTVPVSYTYALLPTTVTTSTGVITASAPINSFTSSYELRAITTMVSVSGTQTALAATGTATTATATGTVATGTATGTGTVTTATATGTATTATGTATTGAATATTGAGTATGVPSTSAPTATATSVPSTSAPTNTATNTPTNTATNTPTNTNTATNTPTNTATNTSVAPTATRTTAPTQAPVNTPAPTATPFPTIVLTPPSGTVTATPRPTTQPCHFRLVLVYARAVPRHRNHTKGRPVVIVEGLNGADSGRRQPYSQTPLFFDDNHGVIIFSRKTYHSLSCSGNGKGTLLDVSGTVLYGQAIVRHRKVNLYNAGFQVRIVAAGKGRYTLRVDIARINYHVTFTGLQGVIDTRR